MQSYLVAPFQFLKNMLGSAVGAEMPFLGLPGEVLMPGDRPGTVPAVKRVTRSHQRLDGVVFGFDPDSVPVYRVNDSSYEVRFVLSGLHTDAGETGWDLIPYPICYSLEGLSHVRCVFFAGALLGVRCELAPLPRSPSEAMRWSI